MDGANLRAELEDAVQSAIDGVLEHHRIDASTEVHVRVDLGGEVRADVAVVKLQPVEDEPHRFDLLELDEVRP
jgi:hypothetical protein